MVPVSFSRWCSCKLMSPSYACPPMFPIWNHAISWGPSLVLMINHMFLFLLLKPLQIFLMLGIFTLSSVDSWGTIFLCPEKCKMFSRISGPSTSWGVKVQILKLLSVREEWICVEHHCFVLGRQCMVTSVCLTGVWNLHVQKSSHSLASCSGSYQALWLVATGRATTDSVTWQGLGTSWAVLFGQYCQE